MKNKKTTLKITLSGMFLALALVLPFLTGQIPEIGSMLSPMHLPIFLCGIICGYKYGLIVGFIAPLLRSLVFSMPPLYPTAIAMAFELSVYGLISGLLYNLFKNKGPNFKYHIIFIYISLIVAMIIGRIAWGSVRFLLTLIDDTLQFSFQAFLTGAFISAWPGIIVQLILIPAIVLSLEKAKIIE